MKTLAIVLIMLISTLGPSAVIAAVGYSSVRALGRNPSAAPKILLSMILAFVFGMGTIFLVYRISWRGGKIPIETLLLAGIAVGLFFSAITSLLMYTAAESVHRIVFWIMGGFWGSSWSRLLMVIPFIGFGISAIHFFARDLNILQLGEESAAHLGVEVERTKRIILVFASLIAASAVSVSGVIGFVGLIIPHIARLLVGPDHRMLLPTSCLIGAIFLLWCDTLARVIIAPVELPVGIITACFGAPFFIYLLTRGKRG